MHFSIELKVFLLTEAPYQVLAFGQEASFYAFTPLLNKIDVWYLRKILNKLSKAAKESFLYSSLRFFAKHKTVFPQSNKLFHQAHSPL